jgi:hypothetical protein
MKKKFMASGLTLPRKLNDGSSGLSIPMPTLMPHEQAIPLVTKANSSRT